MENKNPCSFLKIIIIVVLPKYKLLEWNNCKMISVKLCGKEHKKMVKRMHMKYQFIMGPAIGQTMQQYSGW